MLSEGIEPREGTQTVHAEGPRINMLTAIRRTLEHELAVNPRVCVFGEDVGRKGGVHAATLGLQDKFGAARVFDTSLSEEGIIGRAVGMALAGLMPVPEIQFRKYAEPAAEQLNDCGTMRWRTDNRFAAPMVVRMPGGFFKCGDPWHSQMQRSAVRACGRLARRDAVERRGCRRPAAHGAARQRSDDLLRAPRDAGRRPGARPYPGDEYVVPFGKARLLRKGTELTVVTWGAMVERCEQAAADSAVDVEMLDLRTLCPGIARRCSSPCARRVAASSCTRTRSPRASAPRSRRPSPARPSSTSMRRSSASPCRTSRARTARCCSKPWCRASAHRAGDPPPREYLMTATIEIRAPPEQIEGTRSQVQRWLKASASRRRERAAGRARDRQGHGRGPGAGRRRARGNPQAGTGRDRAGRGARAHPGRRRTQAAAKAPAQKSRGARHRRRGHGSVDGPRRGAIRWSQQPGGAPPARGARGPRDQVRGSGAGGRITVEDVLGRAARKQPPASPAARERRRFPVRWGGRACRTRRCAGASRSTWSKACCIPRRTSRRFRSRHGSRARASRAPRRNSSSAARR